jgi:hypothetical protein
VEKKGGIKGNKVKQSKINAKYPDKKNIRLFFIYAEETKPQMIKVNFMELIIRIKNCITWYVLIKQVVKT